jgi:PAS domain S-box-containing protein
VQDKERKLMSETKEKLKGNDKPDLIQSDEAKFFLASIVESLEDSVVSVDFNTIITSWNKGAERLYGYSAEEVIGKPLTMLTLPEDLHQVLANIETVRRGGKVKVYETERIHKDGHHIHLLITLSPVKNDGGEIIGVSTVARDITKRRQSEEGLRESHLRMVEILESINDAFYAVDPDFNFTYVNKKAEEWWGRKRETLIGKHCWTEFPQVVGSESYRLHYIALKEQRAISCETVSPLLGHWIDVSIYPDNRGGLSVYFRDITERKRADEELREVHERITDILESITDCFFALDAERRFTYVNSQTEAYFGIPREQMLGRPLTEVLPKVKGHEIEHRQEEVMTERKPVHFETLSPATGRWVELHFYPLKEGLAAYFRDVTERKRAEEALRQSEGRFRALISQATAGITQTDKSGKFIFANERYCEIVGYSHEELLNMRMQNISDPEIVPANVKLYKRIWTDGTPFVIEKQYIRKDGSRIWVNNSVAPVINASGKTESVVCVTIDITKRKRAEEALRESEERLRLAIDISQTSTFDIDLLTDAVQTDEIGRKIYGWAPDEPLTFSKVQSHFHPDDKEYVLQSVGAAFEPEGKDEFEVEQRIIRTDSETRWIRVHGRAFFEGEGTERRAVRCLGTYIDITESKLAEESLKYQKAMLEALTETVPDGILIVSSEGKMLHANRRFSDIWNFPPEIVESQSDEDALRWAAEQTANPKAFLARVYSIYEQPVSEVREEVIMKDGRVYERFGAPIRSNETDAYFGWVWTFRDITERQRLLQREHSARLQAEEANRLKDEFLATVSHELRTPLNAILGWSQMLISGSFDPDNASRALETIYRNAKSQAQLIEDILDVSRIITGKLRLNARLISVSPIIQAVVESLRPSIEAKNIRLHMALDFEPRMACADPDRLQQVIWNLLSNAIKFTPEKGQITVELESGESETKIIVSDTGKGISPEFLPFVFERFRQADGSTTRQHGGLGLGLAIVRHIVELHGGTVEVGSGGEGKGTTFTVSLPLPETPLSSAGETNEENSGAKQSNPGEAEKAVYESEIKGLRVLLVDDENDTLELLATVLVQNGAEAKSHTNVADALETIKEWKPDVIISDIAMPEEDGYSFIKKLRALPPEEGGKIPAIALTAYVGIRERTQVLSSGFQMYIPKPVEPTELVSTLASLV